MKEFERDYGEDGGLEFGPTWVKTSERRGRRTVLMGRDSLGRFVLGRHVKLKLAGQVEEILKRRPMVRQPLPYGTLEAKQW